MPEYSHEQNLRLAQKMLEQQGEINDLREQLKQAKACLRAARFVEGHWRNHFLTAGNAAAAHALAAVRAALDGATDPTACGLPGEAHAGFRAALNPPTDEETDHA